MIEQAKTILKSIFGYDGFISLQEKIVQNVLSGRDTLAVMPTGGGKSVCYQIPALILEGLTIVVSPLISLMKDQVDQLAQLGIPSVLLNSSLTPQAYRVNVEKIRDGKAKLLYVAPETLLKPKMLALLETIPVACLAIDEAHCISEWGPDFRPEYRQLAEVRARIPHAVCIALTATATPRIRNDIRRCLGFDASAEFVASFNRENLFIRVVHKEKPSRQAVGFLRRFPNESGIIYCLTRKQVDDLTVALRSEGFSACSYHAGLSEAERSQSQEQFLRDDLRIIVATIAFGMGIDKSNVRFVLHYDLPRSIESYYQEIGRAGRDGLRAECLLLFSYADVQKARALVAQKEGLEERVASLQLNAMVQFAESEVCRRVPLLGYFGEGFPPETCDMCDNCLAGERETKELTIPAQKFLSCVKRTGERFGSAHIINVLRGSRAEKVFQCGHDSLSTYGIGMELSRKQWLQLTRQLIHKGLVLRDPEFGGLSLTPRAWVLLKGGETFFGTIDEVVDHESSPGRPAWDPSSQYDSGLYEDLRRRRRELADAANVPAYVIFSDRTLAEMAANFPRTGENLLAVHGVGVAKLEKYGSIFLDIIRDYCREHSIPDQPGNPSLPAWESPMEGTGKRHIVIGEAFNSGQSIENLARKYAVKEVTILDHLFRFSQEGHPLRPGGILPLITLSEQNRAKVMDAFGALGPLLLRSVFDALDGAIGYEDLKVLRLYHLSCQNPFKGAPSLVSQGDPQSRTIICLANSRKFSGSCVAGKELLEGRVGEWIRPVSREATGELSIQDIGMQNGRVPGLLDVITVPLKGACPRDYQSENHCISGARWVWNGTYPVSELPGICDEVDMIWMNGTHSQNGLNDRMPAGLVQRTLSSSLLLVRGEKLCIIVGEGSRGLKQVRAQFAYRGETYRFSVTDPVVEAGHLKKEFGRYPVDGTAVYLTLSISEPFEGFCYKLVAGVIV